MNIIALTTPTCVKCKSVIPRVKELCEEHNVQIEVLNAMSDEVAKSYVHKYGINSVPTFVLVDNGTEALVSGESSYYQIKEILEP